MVHTLDRLDTIYCTGSEWEDALFSSHETLIKVAYFGDERYRVLAYKSIGDVWAAWFNLTLEEPSVDDMIEAISAAFRKVN